MNPHIFDPLTDYCIGCGLAAYVFLNNNCVPQACPDNDHRTYLIARFAMENMLTEVYGIMAEMGESQTRPTIH